MTNKTAADFCQQISLLRTRRKFKKTARLGQCLARLFSGIGPPRKKEEEKR